MGATQARSTHVDSMPDVIGSGPPPLGRLPSTTGRPDPEGLWSLGLWSMAPGEGG